MTERNGVAGDPDRLTSGEKAALSDTICLLRQSVDEMRHELIKRRIIIIAVTILVLMMGWFLVSLNHLVGEITQVQNTQAQQISGSNFTRSLLCQTIYYDSDRKTPVPLGCRRDVIVEQYPHEFCEVASEMCVPLTPDEQRTLDG